MSRKRLSIEERLVRALKAYPFPHGMTEGLLANYAQLTVRHPVFQETLTRLEQEGTVSIEWQQWGNCRRVKLVSK